MNINALCYFLISTISLISFTSTTFATENQVIKLGSSDIRNYQQGNTIHYKSVLAGSGIALTGNIKQTVGDTVTNPSGKVCRVHSITATYNGVGGPAPVNIRLLYFQDEHNSLFNCGYFDEKSAKYIFINDTETTPDGVALNLESPLKIGNSTSNLISYSNGTWKDCTRTVQATENIDTAVGVYESYKILENCSTNADNASTMTLVWFVPDIFIVKESGSGDAITGDFTLESFAFN